MSRTRSYKKQICCHPQCINGGRPADFENIKCWLEAGNAGKVFCSPECGENYVENFEKITEAERFQKAIEKKKERHKKSYTEQLVQAIYLCSDKTFDKDKIVKVIRTLELKSDWVEKKMSD